MSTAERKGVDHDRVEARRTAEIAKPPHVGGTGADEQTRVATRLDCSCLGHRALLDELLDAANAEIAFELVFQHAGGFSCGHSPACGLGGDGACFSQLRSPPGTAISHGDSCHCWGNRSAVADHDSLFYCLDRSFVTDGCGDLQLHCSLLHYSQ